MDLESQQQSMFTTEELQVIQNWANDFNNEIPGLYIEQINQFVAFTIQKMNQQLQNLLNLKIQCTLPFYFDKDLQLMVIEQQRSLSTQSRYFQLHNAPEFIESCQRSMFPIMKQFISLATKYYITDPRINFKTIFDQDPEQINTLLKNEIQRTQQKIINQIIECPRQGEGITIQEFYRKLAEQQRKQQEIKEQEKELLLYKQKQLLYQQQEKEKERQEQIIKDKQYQKQYQLEEQNRIHQQQQLLLKQQAAGNKQEFHTYQGSRNQEIGNQNDITSKNYDFHNQGQNTIINNLIDAKQYEQNRPVDIRINPNPTPQDSLRNTMQNSKNLIQSNPSNLSGQKVPENPEQDLSNQYPKKKITLLSVQTITTQPSELMSREKSVSTHNPNQQQQQQQQQSHQHTNSGQLNPQNRSQIRK